MTDEEKEILTSSFVSEFDFDWEKSYTDSKIKLTAETPRGDVLSQVVVDYVNSTRIFLKIKMKEIEEISKDKKKNQKLKKNS